MDLQGIGQSYAHLTYKSSEQLAGKVQATDGQGRQLTLSYDRRTSLELDVRSLQRWESFSKVDRSKRLFHTTTEQTYGQYRRHFLSPQQKSIFASYEKVHLNQSASFELKIEMDSGFDLDYFSAENVSERIANMAIQFSGGNTDVLAEMREAIGKGFGEAEKILGGLPDISLQTKTLIDQKLNNYTTGLSQDNIEKEPAFLAV